jgi:tetratricopeptide (TPR) repeat protein
MLSFRRLAALLFLAWLVFAQDVETSMQKQFQEGARALAEGRYVDAERAYEALAKMNPQVAEVSANLGLVYFQEGKYALANRSLREALKLKPGMTQAGYFLAMSLSELGHYEEALPGLETGFKRASDPGLKRLLGLHLTRAYTGMRRDRDAVQTSLELTRLFPNDPEVLYETGRVCGNFAYLAMQKLASVAADSVWRLQASAELFEAEGQYDAAIANYRKILEREPRRPGIHFRVGRCLLVRARAQNAEGGSTEALKEFDQELAIDPTNANAAYEAGEIFRKTWELNKARELFEMALQYYPDFEEAHVGLARVLLAQQKADPALAHLQKAVSLNREDDVAYYQLAAVYRHMGNANEQQKALAEFRNLRARRAQQQSALVEVSPVRTVTKQELGSQESE